MAFVYQVEFTPYKFPLPVSLVTAHGHWSERQGLILRLTQENGKTVQGEIAPLPWFRTENLAVAIDFCQQLNGRITAVEIGKIPNNLPCCQFAFGSAELEFNQQNFISKKMSFCQLLPTGEKALDYLRQQKKLKATTIKWKIGIHDFAIEKNLYEQLLNILPPQTKIRLDGNGGLDLPAATQWLTLLDRQLENPNNHIQVEYLEQPLPPEKIKDIFQLNEDFQTNIALDESVASLGQLQQLYDQGWPGFYILKAAIMGDPRKLTAWLADHPIKGIFSSVFETAIARNQVLKLAQQWNLDGYAVGFSPPINPATDDRQE